jgi:tetratricopeptide (TPR) repeat protein
MRLEERYPAADSALRALEDLIARQVVSPSTFAWLSNERDKLDRTKEGRELGDELFRLQDFEKAAAKYSECMKIDSDGKSGTVDNLNAGGRLHAVLHCNRAACLMALRLFHGAVDECTNALKIHSRYMKAILRRARCYTRLQQTQEAIAEYQRWLDLVEEASRASYAPPSPCLFDGPQDVKPAEVALTKKELDDLHKARRRADATAQDEARRQRERQRSSEQSNYWRSNSTRNAQDRRDEWYNEQNGGSRRWDSFTNRGPRSSSNPRPDFGTSGRDNFSRSNSQGRSRQDQFVSPRSSQADHYAILNLTPHASVDDIKRAFRRLALKYHPDKNQDDGAVDNFRRVKLAHEVLTDPIKRRQYDSELRLGRPY